MKKLTAILLVFAMLVPLSTAVAADEVTAQPTVEEILNEYHQKAFEREMYGEVQTASTWSRRSSDARTLEQETVDTLNEAGYEAYHVTADNHDMLEVELNTSFADMGIDSYGSYIVVIDEGEAEEPASTYSRISPEIDFEGPGNNGGYPATYTYNGITYSVRYVTVTPVDDEALTVTAYKRVREDGLIDEEWLELGEFAFSAGIDALVKAPIMSIASLIEQICTDSTVTPMRPGDLQVKIESKWTRYYIQVQDLTFGSWYNRQYSESAISVVDFSGLVRDKSTGEERWLSGGRSQFMTYSPDFHAINDRLYYALVSHTHTNSISRDRANISIYFDGENATGEPYYRFLFTQYSPIT